MLMMQRYKQETHDHGVSESIGFILIFTIIIAGIGLVTLYGYPLLMKQQVSADEKIMEKNMIVLQNDMKSLAYKTVPFKETALKIGGGTLSVYSGSSSPYAVSITSYDPLYSPTSLVQGFHPGELRYESVSSQQDIALENGAVILRPRLKKGSAMLAEPRWFYDPATHTVVINLINIASDGPMAKEGIGTVQMELGETGYNNTPNVQEIDIQFPNAGQGGYDYSVAWDDFMKETFDNQPDLSFSPAGIPGSPTDDLSYRLTGTIPLTLVIKTYEIRIKNI